MAPPFLDKRQSQGLPDCFMPCFIAADLGNCSSISDGACVCTSQVFIESAVACFDRTCGNSTDLEASYELAEINCLRLGYPITLPSPPNASPSPNNGTGSSQPYAPSLYEVPSLRAVNIGMTTACSVLLAITMILGIFACRSRIIKERKDAQSRTWNGAGSTFQTTMPSTSRSAFGFKKSNNAANAREALSFQTASAASEYGFTRTNPDWEDKTQLRSHTFGNARPDTKFALGSIDESSQVELGQSTFGSVVDLHESEAIELPVLRLDGRPLVQEEEDEKHMAHAK